MQENESTVEVYVNLSLRIEQGRNCQEYLVILQMPDTATKHNFTMKSNPHRISLILKHARITVPIYFKLFLKHTDIDRSLSKFTHSSNSFIK